jgi:hypothetical protein
LASRFELKLGNVQQALALFCDKSSRGTLTRLSVTWYIVAEAATLAIIDWLIEFTILARWHELTPSIAW